VPRSIYVVVMANMATLLECQTIYSIRDVYLMTEMKMVDDYNRALANKVAADRRRE
jgi:hypothetical protein